MILSQAVSEVSDAVQFDFCAMLRPYCFTKFEVHTGLLTGPENKVLSRLYPGLECISFYISKFLQSTADPC
jgi:hypothetical protein